MRVSSLGVGWPRAQPPSRSFVRLKLRITTADIARAAKVHQTTVSLALRGDPRVVFGCMESVARQLEELAPAQGPKIGIALVGAAHDAIGCPGMYEDARLVGASAVER